MAVFSVCIEMVGTDRPFFERLPLVREAGFSAFEFWGPAGKDIPALRAEANRLGLRVATFAGSGGASLVDPRGREQAAQALAQAIEVADALGVRDIILTTGPRLADVSYEEQIVTLVDNLRTAARLGEARGKVFNLEMLNTLIDHPGYFLDRTRVGVALVDAVASPAVKLLYDVYHMQIMEGNVIATIKAYADRIGYYHVADVPGRHEPGTGEIAYERVLEAIASTSYDGAIGLEYRPTQDALTSLRRLAERFGTAL